MKQKSVGLTLRAFIIALALILVAGSPALPPFDGVAYAQAAGPTLTATETPGGGGVSLNWSAVDDADNYQVWKGTGSGNNVSWGSTPLATVTTTSYSDTAVDAGSTYSYAVRAGTTGTWSNVPSVTVSGGVSKPTAKSTVTAAADGLSAIDVSWTPVAGATSYDLQYWTSGLSSWTSLASGTTDMTYEHTGLTPGSTYYYVVRGVNTGGNGPWSDWVSQTLEATDTVPVLSHTHTSRQVVDLSWTATSTTATYNLERMKTTTADNSGGTWTALTLSSDDQTNRSHTDNNATYDTGTTRYHYRVQAVENGDKGAYSNVVVVTIPATGQRPVTPAWRAEANGGALTAGTNAATSITLHWIPTSGSTSEIRWKTSADWSTPMEATNPYNHTGLSPATEYTYQVRARNVNGPSLWSAEKSLTTGAAPITGTQVPKVTGLKVTDESESSTVLKIKLTWNAVSSATHYDILRFPSGDNDTAAWAAPADGNNLTSGRITAANVGSPPSWEDEGDQLSNATTYYYVVSAVVDTNNSIDTADELGPWSDYDSVTTIATSIATAAAPTNFTATATGATAIWLSWTAVTGATSYEISWRKDGSSSSSTFSVTGTSTYHSGLSPNTEYLYRIRAKNSDSMTPYTNQEVTATTQVSGLQPPSNFKVEDDTVWPTDPNTTPTYTIDASWTAVTGATGYELQKWNGTAWAVVGTLSNRATTTTASQTDADNLSASTTYYYRVRTVNATHRSAWSSVMSATTDPARPNPPVLVATSTGTSMIRLSWNGVSGATSYKLEAVEGNATDDAGFATPSFTQTLTANVRHYTHSGLKTGHRYSYRLKAVLSDDVETVWSGIANSYTKPGQPTLAAAAVDHQSIRLSWDAVAFVTADDTTIAGHLTGDAEYRIERRKAGESAWTAVSLSSACNETTNACAHTDDSLTAGTRYFYRIRAEVQRDNVWHRSYWGYTSNWTQADPNN